MGIPKFANWLRNHRKFSPSFISRLRIKPDILAIDLNGLIYPVVHKVVEENILPKDVNKRIISGVLEDIKRIVNIVRPTEQLIIAVDGVVPVAKIKQQRERRFGKYGQTDCNTFTLADSPPVDILFDTNQISPGTPFMDELDAALREEFDRIVKGKDLWKTERQRLLTPQEVRFPNVIVLSSHLSPGEGEHKIADLLRQNPTKSCVIHGADADLILITMTLENQVFIMRETMFFEKMTTTYVDINKLEEILRLELNVDFPAQTFMAIMTINGNDFLPHFPAFRVIERTLNALYNGFIKFRRSEKYNKMAEKMCGKYSINWEVYIKFMKFLLDNYHRDLLLDWANNTKLPNRKSCPVRETSKIQDMIRVKGRITPEISDEWYFHSFTGKYRTEDSRENVYVSDRDRRRMFRKYAQGLEWTFKYYTLGVDAVNKYWYYPFQYTPLFPDLVSYLVEKQDLTARMNRDATEGNPSFISLEGHLSTILPRASRFIAPKQMYPLFRTDSPIRDLYPKSVPIQTDGMAVSYETVLFLPFPSPVRMNMVGSRLRKISNLRREDWFISNMKYRRLTEDVPQETLISVPKSVRKVTEQPPKKGMIIEETELRQGSRSVEVVTADDNTIALFTDEIVDVPKKEVDKPVKPKTSKSRIRYEQFGFYVSQLA